VSNGTGNGSKNTVLLKMLIAKVDKLDTAVQQLRVDVAVLKLKAGGWGIIGAAVAIGGKELIMKMVKGG